MRLFKLGAYYNKYLQDFYSKRPFLKNESYNVQHKVLIEDRFGASDFWSAGLSLLGYETFDNISNAEFLQKTWARENGVRFRETDWLFEIAAAQIAEFRPDVLLAADYTTFTPEFLRAVRRECPSVKLVLGWCGAPYQNLDVMREWDVALSCVPEMVSGFREQGLRSFHVNHAFAPRVLEKIDTNKTPEIDFAFVGSILKQSEFHVERERLLLRLVSATNLQIWSDVKQPASLRGKISDIFNRRVSEPTVDERIARRTHPPIFGLEMFQKLRDSRVVFNNHIDISPISASNMRLFETTGVGACLLTDWKANLSELFEPDAEVLTYKSADECIEKVRCVLDDELQRRRIGEAGQRRTLREHTFENRAMRIDEIIRKVLTIQ